MKASKSRDVAIGLIIFALFAIGATGVLVWFVRNVSFGTPVAIVAAGVPVAIALATPAVASAFEKRREIEASQRVRKAEVYAEFMTLWFNHMMLPMIQARQANRAALEPDQASLIPLMNEFTKNMILWGGDDVLKTYAEYRRILTAGNARPSPLETMAQLEELFYEFRKDLGYRNRGLKSTDILSLFINDLDAIGKADGSAAIAIDRSSDPNGTDASRADVASPPARHPRHGRRWEQRPKKP